MWLAMLKLRTVGSRPFDSASEKIVRELIPARSRIPASQPTRA
jgi:hypothetical protein